MASDLHMHTNYSDGVLSPEDLIDAARNAKLRYIAITDHDTVDGVMHLYESNLIPSRNPYVIPGIEFSAHHPERSIHILGYNIDIYNRVLRDTLNEVVEARWSRFSQMVEKLQQLGYAITEADVLRFAGESKAISRSHVAQAMVAKGFFPTVSKVFDEVLEKGKPAYVHHYRLEVEEIISLIHETGGIAVLAHPKLIGDDDIVKSVIQQGIDGLEVFYPQHDQEDTERYMELAKSYNLLMSGGSDFHGIPSRFPNELGIFTIEDSYAEKFYQEIKQL